MKAGWDSEHSNILFHLDPSFLMEYQSSHSFSCQNSLLMT